MQLKVVLFFNSLTGVGSWIWSYWGGNICPPTAHCAALCRLPGDWRADTGKGMQNHTILPTEQNYLHLTHPRWWVTCLLWILQKTTKFHQRKGNSFGKETGFAVRCCLTRHTSAFLEKKFFQAPREGRVTSTALQSQRIANRQDCLGTSMNVSFWFWLPYTSLVLLPGLVLSLGVWTTQWVHSEKFFLFNIKPQAETQSCYTRHLWDCGFFILFYSFPGQNSYLSTGNCRATNAHI